MGSVCNSNNEKRIEEKNKSQNTPPLSRNYSLQKTNIQTTGSGSSRNYSLQKTNIQTTGSGSYGFSSQKTKAETKTIDNINFTDNDVDRLAKIYFNMIMKMAMTNKETIGKGGQATIRKYYSPKFKKTVVEKVININSNTRNTIGDKGILDAINLLKEAIFLYGFDHPNIVKIYDFKSDPPTIIMEYCAKGSLRNILDKKFYLPPIYKIYLIYSICNGLNYVHSKGIVHGDLKCDNILLSDEKRYYVGKYYYPTPKLADFGLGQFHANNVAAGTPGFIAPEIFEGSGLNFKTDIFALGMVMFEILSGLRPLPTDPELAMIFLKEKKIPCTKEVLRKAWELRIEAFLPGINNAYYDAFYTIMVSCIDDDPDKRPDIFQIYSVVKVLYGIIVKISIV